MADAVPVHSGKKSKVVVEPTVEVNRPLPEGVDVNDAKAVKAAQDKQRAELLARAQGIVASEVPEVPDALVGSIGQATSYGKFQKVSEQAYEALDRKGEPTGEVRYAIRVDH